MMFSLFSKKRNIPSRKKGKVSGGELDEISTATVLLGNTSIPLERKHSMVDPSHVSIIEFDGIEPLLGVEYPSDDRSFRNSVSAKDIRNMRFSDDEFFSADITPDRNYYRLSEGKDVYLFKIDSSADNVGLKVPQIDEEPDAVFITDTDAIDDASSSEYLSFVFGDGVRISPDDSDRRICIAEGRFRDGKVMIPSDYADIIPKLTDSAEFSVNTDYPMRVKWDRPNYKVRMMIAPRIEAE